MGYPKYAEDLLKQITERITLPDIPDSNDVDALNFYNHALALRKSAFELILILHGQKPDTINEVFNCREILRENNVLKSEINKYQDEIKELKREKLINENKSLKDLNGSLIKEIQVLESNQSDILYKKAKETERKLRLEIRNELDAKLKDNLNSIDDKIGLLLFTLEDMNNIDNIHSLKSSLKSCMNDASFCCELLKEILL